MSATPPPVTPGGAPTPDEPSKPLEQIIAQRKEKLKELQARGINAFPYSFVRTHSIAHLHEMFGDVSGDQGPETVIRTAGRIMTLRDMGKSCFAHIAEGPDRIQIYVKKDVVGEESYKLFQKDMDLGDFVGVEGTMFRTRTNELSVRVTKLELLAKSLRPLPEKFHGLKDVETRYREREMDLVSNPDIQKLFIRRSQLIQSIRQTLVGEGFLEVETPLLQSQAGGAAARPFKTFHNALQSQLFLRIALELHLKRLLVGGISRVFEIGRVFRNEGVDTMHNPEFTLLEAYQAYADYNDMMTLTEKIIREAAHQANGSDEITLHGKTISLKTPFARASMTELFKQHAGVDVVKAWQEGRLRAVARELHVGFEETTPDHKVFDRIFDLKVQPHLWQPTFVLDYPVEISPLAKKHRSQPGLVERFELFIAGGEVANAYSELNDPVDQRERMEKQATAKQKGDEEAEVVDEDFLAALEHGMPPAGGLGIGIDRLAMLLLGQTSIREVILFPLLKPES
jgi:lysyl-tRNA synthetase, class II